MAQKVIKRGIQKVANGYLVGGLDSYGSELSNPEYFPTFEDACVKLARDYEEEGFANTVKEASAMTQAMSAICGKAIAPKLLALEGKINPGAQNVVDPECGF